MRRESSAPSISSDVHCVECGRPAEGLADGWKAYLSGGFEEEPLEVTVFCPACAVRECASNAAA